MKYYFIESLNIEKYNQLKSTHEMHSSDISDIEGFIVDENDVKLYENDDSFKIYTIPIEEYQNIDEFISDYWDGNFCFEHGFINR